MPYYASTRDLYQGVGDDLVLYAEGSKALKLAENALADADAAIVTSKPPSGS